MKTRGAIDFTIISLCCIWAVIALVLAGLNPCVAAEWKPVPGKLMTPWAEKVNPQSPLPEYPRPQMVRAGWVNLNGLWDYAIVERDASQPPNFAGKILVPFPVESSLSGVRKPLTDKQRLWYRRTFMRKISIGQDEQGVTRILLNNKFAFQCGPLDQGYRPDGIFTAPTDEALHYDIEMTKIVAST